jgi:prepilin-type N-terminal cleavage/methylation domain-containing protein
MDNIKIREHKTGRMKSGAFNSQRGFTLLEILVSLMLLSTALVVVFQLFSANLKGITTSDKYVYAVINAESYMREVLESDDLSEMSWSDTTADGYEVDVTVTGAEDERTENLPVELLQIDLVVHWTEGLRKRNIKLKTLKMVERQI